MEVNLVILMVFMNLAPSSTMSVITVSEDGSCPNIVNRSEWGARPPKLTPEPLAVSPAPYIVVHHGATKTYCTDETSCAAIVRSYQNFHMDTRGWNDIGYNFLIGEDGNVYEGRGWNAVGAHAPGYNTQSIGVCFIGDFSDCLPNDKALQAFTKLVQCGLSLGHLSQNYLLIGHRQVRSTSCPGTVLYDTVVTWPHWTDHPVPLYSNTTTSPSPSENVVTQ